MVDRRAHEAVGVRVVSIDSLVTLNLNPNLYLLTNVLKFEMGVYCVCSIVRLVWQLAIWPVRLQRPPDKPVPRDHAHTRATNPPTEWPDWYLRFLHHARRDPIKANFPCNLFDIKAKEEEKAADIEGSFGSRYSPISHRSSTRSFISS